MAYMTQQKSYSLLLSIWWVSDPHLSCLTRAYSPPLFPVHLLFCCCFFFASVITSANVTKMNYLAASHAVSKQHDPCVSSCTPSWPLAYFIIIASLPCFPTLLAKYPLIQNSPPHNCFLTSGLLRNISRPAMLLITLTPIWSSTLLVGYTLHQKMNTVCIRTYLYKLDVIPLPNSINTSLNSFSTFSPNTVRRYFAGHTMWDSNTVTLCFLWMYSLIHTIKGNVAASREKSYPKDWSLLLGAGIQALLHGRLRITLCYRYFCSLCLIKCLCNAYSASLCGQGLHSR